MKRFLVAYSLLPLLSYADDSGSEIAATTWDERKEQLYQMSREKKAVVQNDAPKAAAAKPASAMTPNSEDRIFKYRPRLCTHEIYGAIEYLYWKPFEQGTDFVVRENPEQINLQRETGQWGSVIEAKFDWASGFRVGLGCVVGPDYWDLAAEYTYIAPNRSFTETADPSAGSYMYATYNNFTNSAMVSANSRIGMHYNIGDLILSRRFQISKQILLRWCMGGSGAWISQHWNIVNIGEEGARVPPGAFTITRNNWEFKGGGFKTGFESDWYIGSGFSLLGKFKAALYFGNYENVHLRKAAFLPMNNPTNIDANPSLHDHRFVPTFQAIIGPSWGIRSGSWAVNLFAGYELNYWLNLQEVLYSDSSNDAENARPSRYVNAPFGLQGLTVRFQLNY